MTAPAHAQFPPWRVTYTHNGTTATVAVRGLNDDHAWEVGRRAAKRLHWGEEIRIQRVEAVKEVE